MIIRDGLAKQKLEKIRSGSVVLAAFADYSRSNVACIL